MNRFAAAQKNMVDCQIHPSGIIMPGILEAFSTVPRELFVPANMAGLAYGDEDLPLGAGRYLLAPAVHAKLLQAAKPKKTDNVLDIGGAGGYGAAILSSMVTHVTALEDRKDFAQKAENAWMELAIPNVTAVTGRMTDGTPGQFYDLIILNGAVAQIPGTIAAQIAPQGRLLAIVKKQGEMLGKAVLMMRTEQGAFSSLPLFDAAAHYLPGFEPKPAFSFS